MVIHMKKSVQVQHSLLLMLTACIWGMAFVSQSKGMDYMHPLTFNGVRSLIGALVLFVYSLATGRLSGKRALKTDRRRTLRAGLLCGLVMTVASTLQQFGIQYTTVGKAGFLTTLYIIFVPLGGILFRKKVRGQVWGAAFIAAVGMYLLCMTERFVLGRGDFLVLLCAIVFAVHIMLVDSFSEGTDGVLISCIQFAVCGVLCSIGALIWGKPTIDQISQGLWPLLYAGVLSCGVGYTLQIVGQRGVNPTAAALIMSLESVFAAVAAWLAFRIGFLQTDQTMTGRQIAGCALVFTAVVLVQLPEKWFSKHHPFYV